MKKYLHTTGNDYRSFKEDLLSVNRDLATILAQGDSLPGTPNLAFEAWNRICQDLQKQINDEVLRIAVVGAIKSGKSTFLNASLNGDYLKRGAGVVTSIVTRIRGGSQNRAKLFFKTWEEINREIVESLAILPTSIPSSELEGFDIRQERNRSELKRALNALAPDQIITNGTRNLNVVLLNCYLNGYEEIARDFGNKQTLVYAKGDFREHWKFVGDDNFAVYLKDIQLEIDTDILDQDIEFADCQGSDSSNPLHLAMIQDYLNVSNLNIYLISSRTGLREADIRFLSIIRKMGILDSLLFVINCDISEHESLKDLKAVARRVKDELDLITSSAPIYVFSALYSLFDAMSDSLPEKDRLRRNQWENQTELTVFLNSERERFENDLKNRLLKERSRLLLNNQIERHRTILSGLGDWIAVNRELVTGDENDVKRIIQRIAQQQERMQQIRTTIETTTAGAVPKIKNELSTDINRFFDHRSGECVGNIVQFIRSYGVDFKRYDDQMQPSGFLNTLNAVFQEFKRALDNTMTDSVYPEVVRFVRGTEKKIENYFYSIFQPYESLVGDAQQELQTILKDFKIKDRTSIDPEPIILPNVDSLRDTVGLKIPPLISFLRYSAQIKTDAFMRLGFYTLVQAFRKLLRKPEPTGKTNYVKALQASVKRMKRLTEESIVYHCKDYRENLKFGYVFKLVDILSQKIAEALFERFQTYGSNTAVMLEQIDQHKLEKENVLKLFEEMDAQSADLNARITELKQRLARPTD